MVGLKQDCSYKVRAFDGRVRYYLVKKADAYADRYKVVDLVNPNGPVRTIRARRHEILKQVRTCSAHSPPRVAQSKTQLYIVKTGKDTYKIGCTNNLAVRMRAGRTWCSRMSVVATRAIPDDTQNTWRFHEKRLLRFVQASHCRGGGSEVFHLNAAALRRTVTFMQRMYLK